MIKLKKIALVLTFACVFTLINGATVAQAAKSCGNWETYSSSTYCDESDGCGFLWLQSTSKTVKNQTRVCSEVSPDNGTVTITREYQTVVSKNGCC